jgi:hypothetical protein
MVAAIAVGPAVHTGVGLIVPLQIGAQKRSAGVAGTADRLFSVVDKDRAGFVGVVVSNPAIVTDDTTVFDVSNDVK